MPLLLHFGRLAGEGDAWQFVWNFWWVQKVFTTPGLHLFHTNLLHWPHGISLLLQTMTLVNSLPAVLLSHFVGYIASYNILVIVHFVLSGMAMYALCYYISKNHFAAFIGGFLFAFSPYRFAHYYGHLHLMTTEVLPFALLFIIRTLEGKPRSWGWAALACALTVYIDLYYLMFLGVAAGAIAIWYFIKDPTSRAKPILIRLALIVACTMLVAAPYLGPLFITKYTTADFNVYGHDPVANSSDLMSFFIPGMRSIFSNLTTHWWSRWSAPWEIGNYVGYSVLFLIAWGLWRLRSKPFIFWLCFGAGFAVLSLGPYLHISGHVITNFPLPYAILMRVFPPINMAGVASRFFVITTIALAVLVSMILATLMQRYRYGKIIAIIFLAVLSIEYLPSQVIASPVVVSDFYHRLAADHATYALLDVSDAQAKVLYYQTIHGHPLVGGYTSRPTVSSNKFLAETPVVNDLLADDQRYQTHIPPSNGKKILTDLQVRYVLIPAGDADLRRYVAGLKIPLVHQDTILEAYQVY